jgi:uncharacterized protein YecA (UPF0149 family)
MNVEDVRNAVRVQGFGRIPRSRGPVRRAGPKIGRNDPCPCGSGLKFKRCCLHSSRQSPIPNP